MQHAAIGPCVDHSRYPAIALCHITLCPRPGLVVENPIERVGDDQALRRLQSERLHVGNEHERACEALPAPDDTELSRLLYRVDGVGAGIGEVADLSLRGLRLQ